MLKTITIVFRLSLCLLSFHNHIPKVVDTPWRFKLPESSFRICFFTERSEDFFCVSLFSFIGYMWWFGYCNCLCIHKKLQCPKQHGIGIAKTTECSQRMYFYHLNMTGAPFVTKLSSPNSDIVTDFVTPPAPMDKGIEPMRDDVTMIFGRICKMRACARDGRIKS